MNLGWSCMSWRQPAALSTHTTASPSNATRNCAGDLIRYLRNIIRMKAFQKFPRFRQTELGVLGFNAQKELVAAGPGEPGYVEDRMIRLRQSIHDHHAEDRSDRRSQHRTLKRHGNKRRPRVERLATHVQRIIHRGHPELE